MIKGSQQVINGSRSLNRVWQPLPLLRCSCFSHSIKVGGSPSFSRDRKIEERTSSRVGLLMASWRCEGGPSLTLAWPVSAHMPIRPLSSHFCYSNHRNLVFSLLNSLSFNCYSIEQLENRNKQEKKVTLIYHQTVIIINVLAYTCVYVTFSCLSKSIHIYNITL